MITQIVVPTVVTFLCLYFLVTLLNKLLFIVKARKVSTIEAPVLSPVTSQEDTTQKETIKRVRQAFKDQKQAMDARAMKAHDPTCEDTWTCTKSPCFIWEPDRIVATSIVKRKTDTERRPNKYQEGQSRETN